MTNKPCFSNGSEWEWWMERNCDRCKKDAKCDGSRFHCAIQSDMLKQAFGSATEEIRLSSWEATQASDCPRLVEKGSPPKHKRPRKEPKGQLLLFEQ